MGGYLAVYLKSRGCDVTCIDNLSRASNRAVRAVRSAGVSLLEIDIRDQREIVRALEGRDAVVHAAALIDVEESIEKPLLYLDNNALGTATVAKACVDAGVKRLIYISSAAVYGDPIKLPIDEDHPTRPLSPYGLSKLIGEQVVDLFSRVYGLEYVVLRLFNVYGPGQTSAYAGVITRFVARVKANLPPIIYGDGEQTRDFVNVRDVCGAVELALVTDHVNEIYNIGSGAATRIKDLAKLVTKLAGVEGEPIYAAPRPGDIRHSCADISKARIYLGFTPRVSLEEGLKELLSRNVLLV